MLIVQRTSHELLASQICLHGRQLFYPREKLQQCRAARKSFRSHLRLLLDQLKFAQRLIDFQVRDCHALASHELLVAEQTCPMRQHFRKALLAILLQPRQALSVG
eukprot:gnl/TRDRNA2_/TRDRNA2_155514_c0_seq1.p1 gnl/TRDRNA2_/TRDRNA2_155514_c0~~gnl/TRDRNA2_/TRDRNA2_155514_c0_seq1.p1  ORF type:complete len:105 (-),score=5.13 gnl/TRDRNA2_/TRDRNA2_155514_c0_seq1:328-642(-)